MSRFKIALPNIKVQEAAPKDSVADSLYPSPKINVKAQPSHAGIIYLDWRDTTPVPVNTTKILQTIPHGYDYIPTAFANYNFDMGTAKQKGILPFITFLFPSAQGVITLNCDTKNVYLKYFSLFSDTIPPFIMTIRFYIFAERGYE